MQRPIVAGTAMFTSSLITTTCTCRILGGIRVPNPHCPFHRGSLSSLGFYRRLLLLLALLVVPVAASAQDSYTLKTYNVGAVAPLQTFTFQATATICNQVASTATTTVNPTRAVWDDVANVGKVCIWTDAGTGPLFSTPLPGSYEATLAATNAAGTSADSTRSPFSRLAVAAVPLNLKIVR